VALHVYRFRREQPLASTTLASLVGAGVTFVDSAAGVVLDVQADSSQLDDLAAVLARDGLVYLSMDPSTSPESDVIIDAMSASEHSMLRQLIHFIDEQGPATGFASGAYRETTYTGPFPTVEIWWESAAKFKRIVDETVTYNANKTIATDQWRMYAADGVTVIATVIDSMTYSGVSETSRTRVIA